MTSIAQLRSYADENIIDSSVAISSKNHKKVFQIARPILVFLSKFFLIPKNVRLILSHLVEIMDAIHPEDNINQDA